MGLDHDFHADLEAAPAFDADAVENAAAVELEAVGGVMGGNAGDQIQGHSRHPGQEAFEDGSADLPAAAHVARTADHVAAFVRLGQHGAHGGHIVRQVAHAHQAPFARRRFQARADGVQGAAPVGVAQGADAGRAARGARIHKAAQGRQGIVLLEIVHHRYRVGMLYRTFDLLQGADDVVALVVDGDDDFQGTGHYIPPNSICRLIQGMISSSAVSRVVVAS